MIQKLVFIFLFMGAICSCSPKIGNALASREDKYEAFYETWDGKIYEVNSVSKNQYFTPWGGDNMVLDGEKINKAQIKAFQNKKGYYFNTFGPSNKEMNNISQSIFAERIIKGKLNLYYNIEPSSEGTKVDYFFQKKDDGTLTRLRTYELKKVIKDNKQCKSLMEDAESEYENLPTWRKKSANRYMGTEKKLTKLLVDVIIEYNNQ
jgi:hypothetical protein